MSDDIACRRLGLADMEAAANVFRSTFDARLPWLAGKRTRDEDRAFWRGYLFVNCTIWGAERQGELLGVIAFREGWIDQLYVLPDVQGRGIGSRLLAVAKAGHHRLNLWTFQRNEFARHFYESRGFALVRETDGADNEEREPDVLYCWRL